MDNANTWKILISMLFLCGNFPKLFFSHFLQKYTMIFWVHTAPIMMVYTRTGLSVFTHVIFNVLKLRLNAEATLYSVHPEWNSYMSKPSQHFIKDKKPNGPWAQKQRNCVQYRKFVWLKSPKAFSNGPKHNCEYNKSIYFL